MKTMHPPAAFTSRSFMAGLLAGACLLFLSWSTALGAANFSVTPILGDIPPSSSIAVFEIRNAGSKPLPFQVQAFSWSQQAGKDIRSPAKDLLIVPPVATVPPGKSQIVRVALRSKDRSREHAYRVVVRELPQNDDSNLQGFALKTLLAFDIPLFFAPENGQRSVDWSVDLARNNALTIGIRNTGSRFARFDELRLSDSSGREVATLAGPLYVLPGANNSWTVPARGTKPSAGTSLELTYSVSGQDTSVPIKVE